MHAIGQTFVGVGDVYIYIYIYIYVICMHVYVCVCMYIYIDRERERETFLNTVLLSKPTYIYTHTLYSSDEFLVCEGEL